jgi:hypothetical protein
VQFDLVVHGQLLPCLAAAFPSEQHLARALELGDTGFRFLQQALTATEAQASSLGTFEEAAVEVPVVFRVGDLGLDVG